MKGSTQTGTEGETYAAQYLEEQGWRILARNFRVRQGEIDIVAENTDFLLFVEVKARGSYRFGAACEAVTPAKQRRLILAAELWLTQHPTCLQPRFDVIEVYWSCTANHPIGLRHLENAFEA